MTKKQTEKFKTAKMSILRFSLGVIRLDKIWNTRISKYANAICKHLATCFGANTKSNETPVSDLIYQETIHRSLGI